MSWSCGVTVDFAGVYDALNNRFIMTVFLKWGPANTVKAFIYVAISATDDPTGLWRTYLFDGYAVPPAKGCLMHYNFLMCRKEILLCGGGKSMGLLCPALTKLVL